MFFLVTEIDPLTEPVMDLHVNKVNTQVKEVYVVTALPDGGCLLCNKISDNKHQVLRLDHNGKTILPSYVCGLYVRGILHSHGVVYILHSKGIITKHPLSDISQVIHRYKVHVQGKMRAGDLLNEQTLILIDDKDGKVFTYNMTTDMQEMVIKGLIGPVQVVCRRYKDMSVIVVCEGLAHVVSIYNHSLKLQKKIMDEKKWDGQLGIPELCMFTPWGTLLVYDLGNGRVSDHSILDGTLKRHVIRDMYNLHSMSYEHPCLWVTQNGEAKRFKLFKSLTVMDNQ